ncbi:hypothetical protein Trydic_g10318 [Trypoxylus dichotomus]
MEKTESVVIAKEPIKCKLDVNDKLIRQSMHCRELIWRNKSMSAESKVRMYKIAVSHVSIHASETRADTAKVKDMMRAAKMKTLKTIKGVSLRDSKSKKQSDKRRTPKFKT